MPDEQDGGRISMDASHTQSVHEENGDTQHQASMLVLMP